MVVLVWENERWGKTSGWRAWCGWRWKSGCYSNSGGIFRPLTPPLLCFHLFLLFFLFFSPFFFNFYFWNKKIIQDEFYDGLALGTKVQNLFFFFLQFWVRNMLLFNGLLMVVPYCHYRWFIWIHWLNLLCFLSIRICFWKFWMTELKWVLGCSYFLLVKLNYHIHGNYLIQNLDMRKWHSSPK